MEKLIVFVEGLDDERFIRKYFSEYYCEVEVVKYIGKKPMKINAYLRSIKSTPLADYIFISDSDGQDYAVKKSKCLLKYPELDEQKVFITCFEIESWYLAVVDKSWCESRRIRYYENTDDISKESFYRLVPQRTDILAFMLEILEYFNINCALQRNRSFKHFVQFYPL